jgi:HlyD family secretion protein
VPDQTNARWQPRSRRRTRIVTATTVVVVLAGAGTAWGLTRRSGDTYRTAVAGTSTVMQTLAATGTVSPVSHANESFQVSGTVAKVAVKTGQQVRAGQVLAHLNRAELRSELRSARSTLASARSRMSGDESGQSVASDVSSNGSSSPTFQSAEPKVVLTSPPTAGSGSSGTSPTRGGGSSNVGSGGTASAGLANEQAAVRRAQQATDVALGVASQALQAADQACTALPVTATATSSPTTSPDPTDTASPAPTSTQTSTSGDACTTAGAVLLAAQQEVDGDEQDVSTAESALTKILSAMATSATKSSHTSTGSQQSQSRGSTTVSAADIALDQASIDQALATVDTDLASLEQGVLRATISGRIAAVTVSHGDQVTASASSPAFVIVGSRQEQTTIDLSASEIRKVKVGMTAHVVADGSSRVLTGRVVAVNAAGIESATGSVTFPVTITLPSGTNVVAGAAASVSLVVASVDDVLSVPTSAVHYSGTTAYVEVLKAGKLARKTVKVGALGAALTEIDSGLVAGDTVVLADLNTSVPSSSSNSSATFNGGGGTFPGGGGGAFARRFTGGGTGQTGTVTFGGPAG